jgi:FkbM family methyltransferase
MDHDHLRRGLAGPNDNNGTKAWGKRLGTLSRRRLSKLRHEVRHGLVPPVVDELFEARRFCRARGGDGGLASYRLAKQARLQLVPFDVSLEGLIVDVGANVGDWTAAVLRTIRAARVLAIEPAPGPQDRLVARLGSDHRVVIDGRAVGARPGRARLNITSHSHATSLRAPRSEMNALYRWGGWDVVDQVDVEVTTLDELVQGQDVRLLKIDVQGTETEVLKGAAKTLESTAALLLEVTLVSHYEGDVTFPGLHEQVSVAGFELVALSDPWVSTQGTLLWMDACYTRR